MAFVRFEDTTGKPVLINRDLVTRVTPYKDDRCTIYFDHENYDRVMGSIDEVQTILEL